MTKLGIALGRSFSFNLGGGAAPTTLGGEIGGGGRQPFTPGLAGLMQLPQQAADRALAVLEVHRASLMFTPGVMGAGIGASDRADNEAAIVLYVNKNSANRPNLPDSIDGVPVTVVLTDEFIAR